MRALVRVVSWVAGLCLVGVLLFFALQQYNFVEPARELLLDAAGVSPSSRVDPCLQNDSAGDIVASIDYTDAHALNVLFDQVDIWHVEAEQQTAVALVSPAQQQWLTQEGFPFSQNTELTDALPDPCTFQVLSLIHI